MMVIDFTPELLPLLWGLLGVLLIATGAIIASIDPEIAEVYLGDRRILLVTAAVAAITLGALAAAGPQIASNLGLSLR
jgi:hypothetical protein